MQETVSAEEKDITRNPDRKLGIVAGGAVRTIARIMLWLFMPMPMKRFLLKTWRTNGYG